MHKATRSVAQSRSAASRMRLQYGLNEADSWWYFARGPQRERIWSRLRQMQPRMIRIFLYDKGTPDPIDSWEEFRTYVDAVLGLGATPMLTFAKLARPFDDPRAVRWFAERCGDVVWDCLEHWGPEQVRRWYWCIWNEPNSTWIGGGLSFEQYRTIYEEAARAMLRWLKPYLDGLPHFGGPSVEGFDPFWLDWIHRFVEEIDPSLIGFVNWHRYADWRDHGERGAPPEEAVHRDLLMAQTADYEARTRDVARLLRGRSIENVCGEWNAHSHYEPHVRARFNQTMFGAAYGAAVLLHLMRAGADAEMLWTGTDEACGYGVLDKDAQPTPLFFAKTLCTRHVRYGDQIWFPIADPTNAPVDVVVAEGANGRRSAVVVHRHNLSAQYDLSEWIEGIPDGARLLRIDQESGARLVSEPFAGRVAFHGYGVAAVTNVTNDWPEIDSLSGNP